MMRALSTSIFILFNVLHLIRYSQPFLLPPMIPKVPTISLIFPECSLKTTSVKTPTCRPSRTSRMAETLNELEAMSPPTKSFTSPSGFNNADWEFEMGKYSESNGNFRSSLSHFHLALSSSTAEALGVKKSASPANVSPAERSLLSPSDVVRVAKDIPVHHTTASIGVGRRRKSRAGQLVTPAMVESSLVFKHPGVVDHRQKRDNSHDSTYQAREGAGAGTGTGAHWDRDYSRQHLSPSSPRCLFRPALARNPEP